MKLDLTKRKQIGTIDFDEKVPVYDYGSKFFAITEKKEIVKKDILITSKKPLFVIDIVDENRYEYLEDVKYTNNNEYSFSAVLDKENTFVMGNKINLEKQEINEEKYISCSSLDINDFDEKSDEYKKLLKAVRKYFNNEEIYDLSILDEDEDEDIYYNFVVFNNVVALLVSDNNEENILIYSLNDDERNEKDEELAYCVLNAEERISFDFCSLLDFTDIEEREIFKTIKYINSLKLKDIAEINIAKILNMNYKSLNKSPKKDMYFELYKQKLINILLHSYL